MGPTKITAFLFALAGLVSAIVAARYWLLGSREYPSELPQSIGDAPALHLLNVQVSIGKTGVLNATAAKWRGAAAILSVLGSVIGLFWARGPITMPLTFKSALVDAGIDPKTVRLLCHKDSKADYGKTPYELFRNDRAKFELYQSHQSTRRRPHLKADHWASFVGTPDIRTLFCGLYASRYVGVGDSDVPQPHREGKIDRAGHYDLYELILLDALKEYSGAFFVNWGASPRQWVQRRTIKRSPSCIANLRKRNFRVPQNSSSDCRKSSCFLADAVESGRTLTPSHNSWRYFVPRKC